MHGDDGASIGSEERADLALLAGAILTCAAALALAGYHPGDLPGRDDVVGVLQLLHHRLVDAGGDAWALTYDPGWLGGAPSYEYVGGLPLLGLLARLGVDAGTAITLLLALVHVAYAFSATRIADQLGRHLGAPRLVPWRSEGLLCCALLALQPILVWRTTHGHALLGWAGLHVVICVGLALDTLARRITATHCAIAALVLVHTFPHPGQQMTLYGLVFGLPIVAGIAWQMRADRRRALAIAVPVAATVAALLWAWPHLGRMFAYYTSDDFGRTAGSASVVYSVGQMGARDLALSVPLAWLPELARRPWHELNVPMGPLPLLALLAPRGFRGLSVGALVAWVLVVGFAADLTPISRALLGLCPLLERFRAPARAAIPVVLLCWPLGLAILRARTPAVGRAWPWPARALAMGAGLASGAWPATEPLVWLGLVAATASRRMRGVVPRAALLAALLSHCATAGRARLLPFLKPEEATAPAERLGERVRRSHPEVRAPLIRVELGTVAGVTYATAWASGLSLFEGYGAVTRRLQELMAAVREKPFNPMLYILTQGVDDERRRAVLRELFDLRWRVEEVAGSLHITPTGASTRGVRAVTRLERVADAAALVGAIRRSPAELASTAHLVGRDGATLGTDWPGCTEARAEAISSGRQPFWIEIRVLAPAPCPIVLPTGYTRRLRAELAGVPLPTFPADLVLFGFVVPAGTSTVRVRYDDSPPVGATPARGLGLGLGLGLLAAWALGRRRRDRPSTPRAA